MDTLMKRVHFLCLKGLKNKGKRNVKMQNRKHSIKNCPRSGQNTTHPQTCTEQNWKNEENEGFATSKQQKNSKIFLKNPSVPSCIAKADRI